MIQGVSQMPAEDEINRATTQYVERISATMVESLRPSREGNTLVLGGQTGSEGYVVIIGTLTALLLPAVQAAREAARRAQSMNSLKQLMLALFNYESATGRFPAQAIRDKDGKPLLSWRVAILPYLEEGQLYEQFHLDEPWDSPHNKELIALMPDVYKLPGQTEETKTHYLGMVGKDYFFSDDAENQGRRIREMTDGTSNTIAMMETDISVIWTKPEDFTFDPDNPTKNLGSLRPGNIVQAAFSDGSVQVISMDAIKASLGKWLTINGGEVTRR